MLGFAGQRYAWASPQTMALGLATVGLLGLFLIHGRRIPEPLLPLHLLTNPVIAPASSISFLVMAANIGLIVYIPVYFQLVFQLSLTASGATLLFMAVLVLVGSYYAGVRMHRTAFVVRLVQVALMLGAAACVILAWRPDSLPPVVAIVLLGMIGLSVGVIYPFTSFSAQNAVEHRHLGVALGVVNWTRSVGGSSGAAVFGAVLFGAGAVSADFLTGGVALVESAVASFRLIFLLCAACFAASLALTLVMEHRPLRTTH